MNSYTLIGILILVISIGIIEVSKIRKWRFWLYFNSLHDYWLPITWNNLEHTSWGEMERCEERAFHLLKMRKKKISWNLNTNCVTDFILKDKLRVWRIILLITGWAHKRQTFTFISIKIWKFGNFLFTRNRVFKNKEVVSIFMFLVMASGKCELHIYFSFPQDF